MVHKTGIRIDPASDEPLFRQLFDQIVARIRSGTFPAGFRLPATRALADEVAANRNTIVRAYEDLEAAGFVHSTVGRGTFVATPPPRATAVAEAPRGGLPWDSLVSRAAAAEPLGRPERYSRNAPHSAPADAVALNRMQPSEDLLPQDLLRRCFDHVLRTLGPRTLGYAPREGLPRLRDLIAENLRARGVPASAGEIIITTGSQQALDLIARTLINPGDSFLVDESTYVGALNLLATAGARLLGLPCDEEGPDPAALQRHTRAGAKGLYLMPNHHNPTGRRISAARRELLVSWSRDAGVPLIEDDYAADLHLEGAPPPPALRALDGEVIHIGTFSKKLIPGLRIGYLLCPPALLSRLVALKHAMDLGTSSLMQHALAEFIERGYLRAHLGRSVPEYRRRRDALEAGLRRHLPQRIRWIHPEAGVSLWLPLAAPDDADSLFEEARRQGVAISPGTLNGIEPRGASGVRLTFCAEPPARLTEGARRLGRAFAALDKRRAGRRPNGEPARMEVV